MHRPSFWLVLSISWLWILPLAAQDSNSALSEIARLERGEVVVDQKDVGATKYVVAKILIDAPPDEVWPILTNPFEFRRRISPRMKEVEVVTDRQDLSVLNVTVDVGFFLPSITYSVESRYEPEQRIDFKRIGGTLKDFKGQWIVLPSDNGKKTQVIYSMYVDPGIPVPQWIVRAGVREELPKTLTSMRERIMDINAGRKAPADRSIMAAAAGGHGLAIHLPHRS